MMKKSEKNSDFDLTNAESVLNFFLMLRLFGGNSERERGGAEKSLKKIKKLI